MTLDARSSSGYAIKEQKIHLPYTSEYLITQEKSSKTVNVNPFAIFTFRGSISMFPSTDEWKETKQAPDIVTDRREQYDNIFGALLPEDGVMGTMWNGWEENWTGRDDSSAASTRRVNRSNAGYCKCCYSNCCLCWFGEKRNYNYHYNYSDRTKN